MNDPGKPSASILVVDDIPFQRELLRAFLQKQGYEVKQAEDGQEAVNAVAEDKPDLVILNVMMPVMDGIEALRQMREQYSAEELPVMMLTASTEDTMRDAAYQAGANFFMGKPFIGEELLERVGLLLDSEKGDAGSDDSAPTASILVVDDEPTVRDLLRDFLEMQDYEVWEAVHGQGGLDAIAEAKPDLVIMGVMMPGMDGLELLRAIRELDGEVPVAEPVQLAALPDAAGDGANPVAEVRKAEPAGVKDALSQERPQMELPEPGPIRF